MRSHTAANRQDALCDSHTLEILRGGFTAHQHHFFAAVRPFFGVFSGKDRFAAGSTRGSGKALADYFCSFYSCRIKLRMEQGVELLGFYAQNGLALGNHPLIHQINRDFQSGSRGAFAVTGLEHEQLAVFNCELHILHIAVVLFQTIRDGGELVVNCRHVFFQMLDGERSAHTGHNILALCIDQVFTEQRFFAGCGIAGKRDAGARIVSGIAEDHFLHVDRCSPVIRDFVHAAVNIGAGIVPGTENRFDGLHQLNLGFTREIGAFFLFVKRFEAADELFHVVFIQIGVLLHAFFRFHSVDYFFKLRLGKLHYHVGEHLYKTAVGVIRKPGISGKFCKFLYNLVVQPQIQDGVHHARHGCTRAGTHGNQQRIPGVGEFLFAKVLHFSKIFIDFRLNIVVNLAAIRVILGAGFSCNSEALRDGHSKTRHFSKVRSLATEELAQLAAALRKHVNKFLTHFDLPPIFC